MTKKEHKSHAITSDLLERYDWYINARWLVLLAVAVPNIAVQLYLNSKNIPVVENLGIAIFVSIYNILLWWLGKRLHKWSIYRFLVLMQLVLDVAAITYIAIINGGLESHAPFLFVVPVMASAVIFSIRAMYATSISIIILYTTLMVAEFYGYLGAHYALNPILVNDKAAFWSTLVFIDSAILITAFVSRFFARLSHKSTKAALRARNKLDEALREHKRTAAEYESRQKALINSIGEGMIVTDEYGNITDVNKMCTELLGYTADSLRGTWLPKAIPTFNLDGEEMKSTDRAAVKALETGKPSKMRAEYQKKNKDRLPVSIVAAPFVIEDRPAGVVVVFRDFRQEMAIERAKDEFVSIVSHQLRTPLTAIRLFSDLLQDEKTGKLNKQQAEYVNKIMISTLRMVRLVGDILNASRIELGRLKIEPKKMQLEDIVKEGVEEIEPVAKDKGIKLAYKHPAKPLPPVKVDANLLAQIVHNLLTNAIRYTSAENGKVEVGVSYNGAKGYHITVSDNGIGIPKKAKKKIFSRFFRAENAVAVEGEGTGLGLYLIKIILKDSGGRIRFSSTEGKGTTFRVIIPKSGMRTKHGDKTLEK